MLSIWNDGFLSKEEKFFLLEYIESFLEDNADKEVKAREILLSNLETITQTHKELVNKNMDVTKAQYKICKEIGYQINKYSSEDKKLVQSMKKTMNDDRKKLLLIDNKIDKSEKKLLKALKYKGILGKIKSFMLYSFVGIILLIIIVQILN